MHTTSEKYLLQIHPWGPKAQQPENDLLTEGMERLLQGATRGAAYRGFHCCTGCGARSGSTDLIVGPYITNSLAAHYLRWHRDEVPVSEMGKLFRLLKEEGMVTAEEIYGGLAPFGHAEEE